MALAMKKKIGITGQQGFIGLHLYNSIALNPEIFERIEFERSFFENEEKLDDFVSKCDVIVHLAAMNRGDDPQIIYNTNVELVKRLIGSLERTNSHAHIIMSSSTQEGKNTLYGESKKEGRKLFTRWEKNSDGIFSGLIIPNVWAIW